MVFNKIKVERKALMIRKSQGIEGFGVPDIFSLIQSQGIYWIRYPLGPNTFCGCALLYQEEPVIVTNSSEILAREFFTAAHELAHVLYDLYQEETPFIVDTALEEGAIQDEREKRAYQFAAELLLPRTKVDEYLRKALRKSGKDLNAFDVVRIQTEFKVSYEAVLVRLHFLGYISKNQRERLKSEQDTRTSRALFSEIGVDDSLLRPWGQIGVSPQFLQWANDNYRAGLIPYESLKRAYALVGAEDSLPPK